MSTVSREVKIFDYNEAYKKSLEYFNGDELAAKTFLGKYALRDNDNNLLEETPTDMHWRIAREFARIEKKKFKNPLSEEQIFSYLDHFGQIVPQGSPMSAIGNYYQVVSLSNCFVLDSPADSYGGILSVDEQLVQICKRRGGVGTNLSNLRPSGAMTHNAARSSTGIVSFMERYSNSIREVGQNGRRGALMLSLSVHHPDCIKSLADGEHAKQITVTNKSRPSIETTTEFYNPDNPDFISVKYDETKITGANLSVMLTDEFMKAVVEDADFEQRWPVDSKTPTIKKTVKARKLWKKIVRSAWQMAEPGILFWDNILKESPADCYAAQGFTTTSTNPCITGDTLVYVADGRGNVPIKVLAEEGKDVPVFCYDDNGGVVVRKMRNPRVTGRRKKIYKVTLDDGSTIRGTNNDKLRLTDGSYKPIGKLVSGDGLNILTRYEASIKDVFKMSNSNSQNYLWINKGQASQYAEHRLIADYYCGGIPYGSIVHHKDYNAQNNTPSNLQVMQKVEHDCLHALNMIGDKNPMRRAQHEWTKEKWEQYHDTMSEAVSGEKNGRFSGFVHGEIRSHAIILTQQLNRRFSKNDWIEYAKKNKLPQNFSSWRKNELGEIVDLSKWAALECGIEHVGEDPRLVKTLKSMILQGYEAYILGNQVLVKKFCEYCGEEFFQDSSKREISFCGRACSNHYLNKYNRTNEKRTKSINETYASRAEVVKSLQLEMYTDLKFKMKRKPFLKEWENGCRKNNIPFRFGTKNGICSFRELRSLAETFNHRVVSVVTDGFEDVYNGTVDEYHNFFIGGFESKTELKKRKWLYINKLQCGEIPLTPHDSCRLLVVNLFSCVRNPFTKDAVFDFDKLFELTKTAQRLMDDLIDLEIEAIDRIISKIKSDPETKDTKDRELKLWSNIREKCINGRRTGTGQTGLGDAMAAVGIKYATEESIEFVEKVYRTLKLGAYRSSVDMAKELGAFPIWDHELEKDNPFLNRIKENDPELYSDMKKYGRRNISLLTTAPTGSVSIMTQTTSGIEPLFMTGYKRRKKVDKSDKDVRVDFVDANSDSWQEFDIYHPKVKMWMDVSGEKDVKKSPWYKCCAEDLDVEMRVELQATAQKHIDHSISSTINLPENVSIEKVKSI
jgi:ribonucleotide reductase alpha subunit